MLPRPILAVVPDPASQDEFPAVTKIPNIAQAFLNFAGKFRCRSLPFFCNLSKLQWPAKKEHAGCGRTGKWLGKQGQPIKRSPAMRRMVLASLLGGLAALWGALPVSATGFCGASGGCPSACPDHCAQPRIRYKTCYQTVVEEKKVTCYETVTKTVMKEVKEVVCKPVYETKEIECKQVVCKPVWEEKQIKVCTHEWVTVQECVPGKERCKLVWVPGGCYVDPCTGCTHYRFGHFERQLVKEPDRIVCKKVCVPKEEIRTVKVCRMVQGRSREENPGDHLPHGQRGSGQEGAGDRLREGAGGKDRESVQARESVRAGVRRAEPPGTPALPAERRPEQPRLPSGLLPYRRLCSGDSGPGTD
jgi:hypothetical protein